MTAAETERLLQGMLASPNLTAASNQVGDAAESAGHHPDIDIRYNKVRLGLVTHDAGGITQKDFDLAVAADKLC